MREEDIHSPDFRVYYNLKSAHMFNELFKILSFLRPKTLAYLAQDLSDSQEEWQYYPENAPAETLQQELWTSDLE